VARHINTTSDTFVNFTIQLTDTFGNYRTKGGEQVNKNRP